MVWQALDLLEYICKTLLLLFFIQDAIQEKERYRPAGKWFFGLLLTVVNWWLASSLWLEQLLYGNEPGTMRTSGYSIVKIAVSFGVSFLAMDFFYQGKRQAKLYLLLVFYAVQELARFALHSIWLILVMGYLDWLGGRLMAEQVDLERYYLLAGGVQFLGVLLFTGGYLALMYVTLRIYRRYLREPVTQTESQGLWFLMLMPMIGMALGAALRIVFYKQEGMEIESLYENHGSMYAVVPVISILCLLCVVYSRKIYSELIRLENEKKDLVFYKQQLTDMTEHVRDMEQLYGGIRSMRHDINNYVADMEQLLQTNQEQGKLTELVKNEAGQYLAGMKQAVSGIFMQYSTGNPVTDVIINRKAQICRQEGISFTEEFLFPQGTGIEAFDLGILLNNALDNAIEACRRVEREDRFIRLKSYTKGRMFFLAVENRYDGRPLAEAEGVCRTTKEDGRLHGLGMKNMKSCVERYYGAMEYEASQGIFVLTLMLQTVDDQKAVIGDKEVNLSKNRTI